MVYFFPVRLLRPRVVASRRRAFEGRRSVRTRAERTPGQKRRRAPADAEVARAHVHSRRRSRRPTSRRGPRRPHPAPAHLPRQKRGRRPARRDVRHRASAREAMCAEARKAREACALFRVCVAPDSEYTDRRLLAVRNRLGRSPPLATAARVEISIEGRSSCLCCLPLRLSSPNPPARQRDGARLGATLRPAGAMAPLSRGVPALISSPALMSALLAFRYARARRRVLLSSSPPGRFDAAGDLPD